MPRLLPSLLIRSFSVILVLQAMLCGVSGADEKKAAWWNAEWTLRKALTVDTTEAGGGITEAVGAAAVLVRLHDGNFQFGAAKEDGADIRFVAEDDKTVLAHHVERYDSLLNEAFVWVKVPEIKAGAQVKFWLYYGNQADSAVRSDDPKATYDAETVLVYHFSEATSAPRDSSPGGNPAEQAGSPVSGAQIGGGLRLTGQNTVSTAASPTLAWTDGAALTWSAWIKPQALGAKAVIYSRREGANALVIGLDNGVPYVELSNASGTQVSSGGEPLALNAWKHLAVVANATQTTVYLDGVSYGTVATGVPALNSASLVGKDTAGPDQAAVGFIGELDELQISKAARSAGFVKFAAINQAGGDKAGKLLVEGADEDAGEAGGHDVIAEHVGLIKDISKSLTIDGWAVIYSCGFLAIVGGIVAVMKLFYINKITKADKIFMKKWEGISSDLTVLDHADSDSVKSMGGVLGAKAQKQLKQSPLYHIYQIGSQEVQHRLSKAEDGFLSLSGRSVQAIKATLHGGLTREVQKLNSNLVFLTIGIAGGPYLGLLGTVIGVMITFQVIASTGEVEVNSIAPGIAGALLATVAGLVVAIPALFAYSYLSTRIKDAVSEMEIFIDEFVAKVAEVFKD
jgi:biopolymer transport protein ExbB